MFDAIRRFFGEKKSGEVAKKRMQIVLLHDRLSISPEVMEEIKNDILRVLSRYMEIDQKSIKVSLEKGDDYAALVSNVHVRRVYRHALSSPENAQKSENSA